MKKRVDKGEEKQYTNQAVPRAGLKKTGKSAGAVRGNSLCSDCGYSRYQTEKTLLADEKSA